MAQPPIMPIQLAQVAGETPVAPTAAPGATGPVEGGNIFDDMLGRAMEALNSVSESELNANKLIDLYVQGKAELSDVMLATSKMTIAVQLAVTAVTTAVSSFKEITSMSI
jgi:flagellar hook-basal body complex protein FliE